MKIGVLTGGGDVPGLNSCIKGLVYRAIDEGNQVLGIRRGWRGLLHYNPQDENSFDHHFMPLNKQNTRTIDRTGGTMLHTSRVNPANMDPEDIPDFLHETGFEQLPTGERDYTPTILENLERLELDVLVPIGGDDTLGYGARLYEEGFPILAIPKTMDNDVFGTDYCIGFSTAVTRSINFIHQLRTAAGSHERLTIVELFGRQSGEPCLIASYLSGVDRCIISEVPFDPEKLASLLVSDYHTNPSNYAIVAISEGARFLDGGTVTSGSPDAYGHRKLGGIGLYAAEALKEITGLGTIYQQIAYLMRSGEPDALDRMVAKNFANLAMDLIGERQFGQMVALQNGRYTHVPGNTINMGMKKVDVDELYDPENYLPRIYSVDKKPMFLY